MGIRPRVCDRLRKRRSRKAAGRRDVDGRMHSVIRIFEEGGHRASGALGGAPARAEALGQTPGFVTLLAIQGDDGALVTVEIFETLDDLTAALSGGGGGEAWPPCPVEQEPCRTISGEIVFQRGL